MATSPIVQIVRSTLGLDGTFTVSRKSAGIRDMLASMTASERKSATALITRNNAAAIRKLGFDRDEAMSLARAARDDRKISIALTDAIGGDTATEARRLAENRTGAAASAASIASVRRRLGVGNGSIDLQIAFDSWASENADKYDLNTVDGKNALYDDWFESELFHTVSGS